MRTLFAFLVLALTLPLTAATPMTKLTVQVTAAETGKPVDRASVIVRFHKSYTKIKIKGMTTSWETKTSQQGTVTLPQIPQGQVTIQIIASNFQTFGDLFDVDQPTQTIAIKLNPPQQQYSAHDKK